MNTCLHFTAICLFAIGLYGLLVKIEQSIILEHSYLADQAAERHGVDPELFRALIKQESNWNPQAVSAQGAAGLTQLMASTALHECGLKAEQRFDVTLNLDCGAHYLAHQLDRFKSVELALAAYNAGPTRVARLKQVPKIAETQNYVNRILASWQGK